MGYDDLSHLDDLSEIERERRKRAITEFELWCDRKGISEKITNDYVRKLTKNSGHKISSAQKKAHRREHGGNPPQDELFTVDDVY